MSQAKPVVPLNVYIIKDYILSQQADKPEEEKLVPHGFADDHLAILEGPHGILVFCSEGVGWEKATLDATFEVGLVPQGDGQSIYMFHTHRVDIPLRTFKEKGTVRQVEIEDFIRRFGHRLESNFRAILQAIKEIGLNPDDYYQGGR